jgi:hypothetical protein
MRAREKDKENNDRKMTDRKMNSRASSGATKRHAAIYVCLAVFFALCFFSHYLARLTMERCNRQFAVMNDKTRNTMILIDWVAANAWLAIAYCFVVVACVGFLQLRRRPPWTYWLTAAFFSIPGFAYWVPCAYIATKALSRS